MEVGVWGSCARECAVIAAGALSLGLLWSAPVAAQVGGERENDRTGRPSGAAPRADAGTSAATEHEAAEAADTEASAAEIAGAGDGTSAEPGEATAASAERAASGDTEGQRSEGPEAYPDAPPLRPSGEPRDLGARYGDALLGMLAGMAGGAAVEGLFWTMAGMAVACAIEGPTDPEDTFGCEWRGGFMGGSVGLGLGLLGGTALGVGRGAGLDAAEGLAVMGLGLATAGAALGLGAGLGALGGYSEIAFGLLVGGVAGGLGYILLTPLYAVALFPDRSQDDADADAASLWPVFAPSTEGLSAGVAGAY